MPIISNLPKYFPGDVYDMFILFNAFSEHENRLKTR